MITCENLTFTYPGAKRPAISGVNLHIPVGELALVTGLSGAGKSTFLRCINGLTPHFSGGRLAGRIRVAGLDPVRASPKEMSRHVGFVFQDPEAQAVMDRVQDDIAFTLENAGIPPREIGERLADILARLELSELRQRRVSTLSGGERQRVAIAAALVFSPGILVLDEPTSQLDPAAAEDVLQAVVNLRRALNLTVVISEHRLERILPHADRLVFFDAGGQGVIDGPPRQVLPRMPYAPRLVSLGLSLGWEPLPLSVEEARWFVENRTRTAAEDAELEQPDEAPRPPRSSASPPIRDGGEVLLAARGVSVALGGRAALDGVDVELLAGEMLALVGANGAGKTTLLRALAGLQRVAQGRIYLDGRDVTGGDPARICRQVGYLPQDPNRLLFADRVIDELALTRRNHGLPLDAPGMEALLGRLGLGECAARYPRDLSAGQRQRAALAAILAAHPAALLLDEPTRGMDPAARQALLELLVEWRQDGKAILLVTHDVELASTADRVAILDGGRLAACGAPETVLPEWPQFCPQVERLFGWVNRRAAA